MSVNAKGVNLTNITVRKTITGARKKPLLAPINRRRQSDNLNILEQELSPDLKEIDFKITTQVIDIRVNGSRMATMEKRPTTIVSDCSTSQIQVMTMQPVMIDTE